MSTTTFTHLAAGDKIDGNGVGREDRIDPYTVLLLGDVTIFPASAGQLDAIIAACETAKAELRTMIIAAWSEAHPEQPTPLDHGGPCDGCLITTDQLFAVTTVSSSGEQDLAVCAKCGSVEHVDELGNAIRLDPDEMDDSDRRADAHDDGCDGSDMPPAEVAA